MSVGYDIIILVKKFAPAFELAVKQKLPLFGGYVQHRMRQRG
jgi:hypothetical protein